MKKRKNRILEGARQALAIARGELDPSTYVVHVPDDDVKALHSTLRLPQFARWRRG